MLLTSAVLLFLNLYAPTMIRRVASTSQRSAILSKAQSIVSSFSGVRVLDRDTVSEVIQSVRDVRIARLLVTDAGAKCLYDSMDESSSLDRLVLYPELAEALRGYDAVHIRYEPDQIVSKAGVPIAVGGEILGAVYLLDRDPDQALLIAGLQRTIFWISIGLETVIVLFSALYSVL
jgi:GAF domain-containing protein